MNIEKWLYYARYIALIGVLCAFLFLILSPLIRF